MAKQSKDVAAQYVRKETFWLVTLLALAVGFFGGVMFGVLKSDTAALPGKPAPLPARAPDSDKSSMIAALEKETQSNPGNLEAWVELGNSYFDSEQYEKSIAAYRKSLEINPDNANVWTDMGVMYRRSGNPQAAINAFEKAIEVDPKHEVSRMNKGIVLLHDLQDVDGAIKAWEGLLEVNPVAMAPTGRSVDEIVQQLKKQKTSRPAPKRQF
jgi:cytochrome c-type biogenesis protein CcmH/NrfG